MSDQAPLVKELKSQVDAAASITADPVTVLGEAPFDGTVTDVRYVPSGNVTGANTNSRTLTVTNRGQAGSGSTVVATLALTSGVNLVAEDEKSLTLSGTAANLVVASGDVLSFDSTHAGTGITDPGGQVVVSISRS